MVKTINPMQKKGEGARTQCACVILTATLLRKEFMWRKSARQATTMTHACALGGGCCFAFETVERQHVFTKTTIAAHLISPRRKTTWSYLEIMTFNIRSKSACATKNQ